MNYMNKKLVKLHEWTDFLIPYMLIVLLFVIIIEIFFVAFYQDHHIIFELIDGFIITLFVIDIAFKFKRSKTYPEFFKASWLDIIATFPMFLVFRMFEALGLFRLLVSSSIDGQRMAMISSDVATEIGYIQKSQRMERFERFLKPLFRTPRFLKGIHFFAEPTHNVKN